jgi:D-lyxose ketol-isomerase
VLVQVEDEGYDLAPGASVTIPPNALHTFTVLSPSTKFLTVSLTDAMGRFHADLDASVPRDRPLVEAMGELSAVLSRHDVTVPGFASSVSEVGSR